METMAGSPSGIRASPSIKKLTFHQIDIKTNQ
jgi:hypothetical protein